MAALDKTRRYDMPAVFGPSLMPATSAVPWFEAVVVAFETERAAAQALMAPYFQVAERANVSISRMTYRGVDYLGGRGYEEIVVGIDAVYDGPDGRIEAQYMPVLWVSETSALIAGREYMGYAKLGGEIPEVDRADDRRGFSCAEFGTPLLDAAAEDLQPITGEALDRVRAATAEGLGLGWKYIAAPGGGVDADYPTVVANRWNYEKAWTGRSVLNLAAPDARAAPCSARVMAALAALPVVRMRRAFVGEGSCVIDRAATRRLAV